MKNFEINVDVQRLLREIGTMGSYNGFNHVIKDLIKYVYVCSIKGKDMVFPENILGEYEDNHILRIIWSLLVLLYGEYGTSPRMGWLEGQYTEEIIKFLVCILIEDIDYSKIVLEKLE